MSDELKYYYLVSSMLICSTYHAAKLRHHGENLTELNTEMLTIKTQHKGGD